MHTPRFAVSLLALASITAACGEDEPSQSSADGLATSDDSTEPASDDGVSAGDGSEAVTIVAEDIMFDTTELSAAVGETLHISFDNRDDGVDHSLHVRDTADGDQMTDIAEGPVTQTMTVTFDQAGEYEYFCDVHPFMTGTITVD